MRSTPLPPPDLTDRQREVLALIAQGKRNEQIAAELFISVNTVKGHVRLLLRHFDVDNRTQLVAKALQA